MSTAENSFDAFLTLALSETTTQATSAINETMAILNDVDTFSAILVSMREAKSGQVVSLASAFVDIV